MNKRFVRWQGYLINQLTFTLNLFLGLAVGSLAFSITLIKDKEFLLSGCPKLIFKISLISLCFSIVFSCCAVVSRLLDFRFTVKKIKADENKEFEESSVYKYKHKWLGELTWKLFWVQLVTLAIGLCGLIAAVLSGYGSRIW